MRARTPANLHAHARFSGVCCPIPLTRSAVAEEVSGQLGGHDALQPLQQVHLLRKDAAGAATWFMRAAASGRLHAPARVATDPPHKKLQGMAARRTIGCPRNAPWACWRAAGSVVP